MPTHVKPNIMLLMRIQMNMPIATINPRSL